MSFIKSYAKDSLLEYPNSRHNRDIFIAVDGEEQATRMALRKIASYNGDSNARNSNSVPFLVCTEMLKMFLSGVHINSKHMIYLMSIAIKQLSMNFVIDRFNHYDTLGFYKRFQQGELPFLHYSKPSINHTSLFRDYSINPFQMEQPIWWASMMSMLGLFDQQLFHYEGALRALNLVSPEQQITRDIFLKFIFDEYSKYVEGKYVLGDIKVKKMKNSIFTLEPFPEDAEIFELMPHNGCSTCSWASMDEICQWFLPRGCPFCKVELELSNFKKITNNDHIEELKVFEDSVSDFRIKTELIKPLEVTSVTNISDKKGIIIMMEGTVGSGKTSARNELISQFREKYPSVYVEVFSPDDINKRNPIGSKPTINGVFIVKENLKKFIQMDKFKIGIIDTCGDIFNKKDPNKMCFDISLNGFDIKYFRPNFNIHDPVGYMSFSLDNVLRRTQHSLSTEYYLNPKSATVATCVKVHFDKAKFLFNRRIGYLVNMNSKLDDILQQIQHEANKYRSSLRTIHSQVEYFISNHVQL